MRVRVPKIFGVLFASVQRIVTLHRREKWPAHAAKSVLYLRLYVGLEKENRSHHISWRSLHKNGKLF